MEERNSKGQPNPITLNIYPGEGGEYTLYLDDGVSRSSALKQDSRCRGDSQANSEYRETRIIHTYTDEKTREIKVERIHDNYTPKFEDSFFVAVLHEPNGSKESSGSLKSVNINGQDVSLITGDIAVAT